MASIEVRTGPKGTSYKVVWYEPIPRKPKEKVRRSKTWPSQPEAEMWKSIIERVDGNEEAATLHLATQGSKALTVDEVAAHRLERMRATPFTKQTYESYMRNHITPAFGNWPVNTVTDDDVRRFIIRKEDAKLSAKMIRNICGWLSSIFSHAIERGWRESHPVKPEMLPEVTREDEEDMFLTLAEAHAIIDRMPERHRDPARLMLATGLRPGELRALNVGDINLTAKQPVVRVTKAMKQDRVNGDYVGPPKSKKSVRSVGISPATAQMLRTYTGGRNAGEILFPTVDGNRLPAQTFRLGFVAGCKRARADKLTIKSPSLYSLRHTHASLMLAAGMSIWQLAKHLGHSSVTTTENNYAHLMPDAHYVAASYAEKALEADVVTGEIET